MTLTNGSASAGGFGAPPAGAGMFQGVDGFSASANIQLLLQTNNDLILAVHKAMVDTSQDLGRKIENLRDDIRDIKLNQQKNDHTLQEESTNWRGHVETLLKEQGDRHLQDTARLQDMLMKMCIGPQQPQWPMIGSGPSAGGPQFAAIAGAPKLPSMPDLLYGQPPPSFNANAAAFYPSQMPPPLSSVPLPQLSAPLALSQQPPATTMAIPSSQQVQVVPQQQQPSALVKKPSPPPAAVAPPTTKQVQEPAGFTFKKATTTTTAAATTAPPAFGTSNSTTTTAVPTTRTFGLSMFGDGAAAKAQEQQQKPPTPAAAGYKPPSTTTGTAAGFVAATAAPPFSAATVTPINKSAGIGTTPQPPQPLSATTTTGTGTGNLFGGTGGMFGGGGGITTGGSLFGGGTKTGTNTFANLAAKTGGGFLGAVSTGSGMTPAAATTTGPPKLPTSQFVASPFGSAKDFKLFGASPNASARSKDTSYRERATEEENEESDKDEDEYTPDAHYEPAVPLPPEVEVVSGEEGEEVRFVARCKLYRFDRDSKENKERGLGDIKVLFNPATKKYRCVMRREKVLKLAANFPILGDLKLHKREQMPQVYTWACKDFSDDQVNGADETFSARFKDANIASEFNQKMTEAINEMQQQE